MSNTKLVPSSYRKLVSDIAALYEGARRVLVEAYWKTGQRIVEVEQQGAIKAAYGAGLLFKLSEDLTRQCGQGFSESNLRRMRQFYLAYPKRAAPHELTWAQYAELLPVGNAAVRDRLVKRAREEGLNHKELRKLVRRELVREQVARKLQGPAPKDGTVETPDLLVPPKDLTLRTYRKAEHWQAKGKTVLDCGFYVYRTVASTELKSVIVTDRPCYVYSASVERVVDGDTLALVIDVGFGTQVREKVRLRGIGCPELGTEEGGAAKRFVMKLLPVGTDLVIRSSKSDKYGRFVADIFFTGGSDQTVFLNNLLLKKGMAIRMKA